MSFPLCVRPARLKTFAWVGVALALCFAILAGLRSSRAGEARPHDRMYKHARMLIALAEVRNEKDAVILVASRTGKNPAVAAEFAKMGGEVHYRADDVDYLRGRLPVGQIMALAASPDVQSLDLDVDTDRFDQRLI